MLIVGIRPLMTNLIKIWVEFDNRIWCIWESILLVSNLQECLIGRGIELQFIQQQIWKCLLFLRKCSKSWDYSGEQLRQALCCHIAYWRKKDNEQLNKNTNIASIYFILRKCNFLHIATTQVFLFTDHSFLTEPCKETTIIIPLFRWGN